VFYAAIPSASNKRIERTPQAQNHPNALGCRSCATTLGAQLRVTGTNLSAPMRFITIVEVSLCTPGRSPSSRS